MYNNILKIARAIICVAGIMVITLIGIAVNKAINNENIKKRDIIVEQQAIEEPIVKETKEKVKEVEKKSTPTETKVSNRNTKPIQNTEFATESENVTISTPDVDTTTITSGTSLGNFKITAYCNCSKCCGKWAGGPTASGTMPVAGRTIAVDPRVIPLGTQVIIDGHTYVAEDTGGAIKGNKIDMYFGSHSEALAWGVRYKNVSLAN